MALNDGERQVAPTRAGIRRDHVARYEMVANRFLESGGNTAIDIACGVGYGAYLLAYKAFLRVCAVDRDEETLQYAKRHYWHERVQYVAADAGVDPLLPLGQFDVAVCFETIEHIKDPLPLLKNLHQVAPLLYASVPNEDVYPWNGYAFHFRHYTKGQFAALLTAAGWQVDEWWGQEGPESDPARGVNGRTLIAVCTRRVEGAASDTSADVSTGQVSAQPPALTAGAPGHVAILGLGPSVSAYLEITKRMGGRRRFCDETWVINALGNVFDCDRVFHMDDVRIQEIRAAARPDSNIAAMVQWLRAHPGPVYTSRTHPDYPGLVAYPLQDVVDDAGYAYMNSTAAYAVAYAIHLKVKKITLFGFDFTYANSHQAEKGRACVEFWLGIAAARGIKLSIPRSSSLMDGCEKPANKLYGYDTLDVHVAREGGRLVVHMTERAGPLPSADEIEHRYDHSRHPNALAEAETQPEA